VSGDVQVLDLASCEFRGMGTAVHILVLEGVDDDLHWARHEVDRLESLWSRFRDDSEVSRINDRAGSWVSVSSETIDLLDAARLASITTAGAFDPLLGGELTRLGYDRTFDAIDVTGAGAPYCPLDRRPARRPVELEVDANRRTVRIPRHTALDLGGIAKGWTADRLVVGLLDRGAGGACANLGGDLSVGGSAPHPSGWAIDVVHAATTQPSRVLVLTAGGVATSTTLRRAWLGPGGEPRHHLLDPRTGMPCASGILEVTVVARSAAQAEVLSKVAFAAPDGFSQALTDGGGAAAIVTSGDGVMVALGNPTLLGDGSAEEPAHAG